MNMAVRFTLFFTALLLLTAGVVPPYGVVTQSGGMEFRRFALIFAKPDYYETVMPGQLLAELACVLAAGLLISAGLWNWPRRRGRADEPAR
jgi:hypothetical protein